MAPRKAPEVAPGRHLERIVERGGSGEWLERVLRGVPGRPLGTKMTIAWWVFEGFRKARGPDVARPGEALGAKMSISWWVFEGLFANLSQNVEKHIVF